MRSHRAVVRVSEAGTRSDARRTIVISCRAEGPRRAITHDTAGASKLVGCADTILLIAMASPDAFVDVRTQRPAERGPFDANDSMATRARAPAAVFTAGRSIARWHAWCWKRRPAIATARGRCIVWQCRRHCDCRPTQTQHAPEQLPPAASSRQRLYLCIEPSIVHLLHRRLRSRNVREAQCEDNWCWQAGC
jgi:hypothetical protein